MPDQEENADIIISQIQIIMSAIDEDQCYTALNECDFFIKMLPVELQKEKNIAKLQKRLNNFLLNQSNVRILRLLQKLKTEVDTAIEYFDLDIGTDERLFFQTELEQDLLLTYAEIRNMFGWIIREKLGGDLDL
jgi:hypothetical protein